MTQSVLERDLHDLTVTSSEGDKIGTVNDVYYDATTQAPQWAAVKTGHFGRHESLVPLGAATLEGDELHVPYTKDEVESAPVQDPGDDLTQADEAKLSAHYHLDLTAPAAEIPAATEFAEPATQEYAEPRTTGGPELTRSEEELHVGTERVRTGIARLRKTVVTENVTQTVPVSHEEVHIVREPIAPGETVDGELTDDVAEVTLYEEHPVVQKVRVPKERVRLETSEIKDRETVSETVRKERIVDDGG